MRDLTGGVPGGLDRRGKLNNNSPEMAEGKPESYKWILSLVVGIAFGGLGGSIFTWYMNRPKPTVLTYRIATTTLSAPEASGLIPDLKVQISGITIQALYANNIELLPRQGPYIENADVAFTFPSPVHIYGMHLETASNLHTLQCLGFVAGSAVNQQLPSPVAEISSIRCALHPIAFQDKDTQPFRLTIATNSNQVPRVQAVAKGLVLLPEEQFSGNVRADERGGFPLLAVVSVSLMLMMSLLTLVYLIVNSRRERFLANEIDLKRLEGYLKRKSE